MSLKSNIEWTDATWNVIVGCTKISPGCKNCSALRDAQRLSHNPHPKIAAKYAGVVTADGTNWTGKINFSEPDLTLPLKWKRPLRIFPNYTSDWSHRNVADEWRDKIFGVMALADWHTYQLLTKRADIALAYLKKRSRMKIGPGVWNDVAWFAGAIAADFCYVKGEGLGRRRQLYDELMKKVGRLDTGESWPLRHVWLGFSAENQDEFDKRWKGFRPLADLGWTIFVSAEPLLGRVTLPPDFLSLGRRALVIAGGESGKLARPSHPDWFTSLQEQCEPADVYFNFKQWGEWAPASALDHLPPDHKLPRKIPHVHMNDAGVCAGVESNIIMNRVGKHTAGRMLKGRVWDDMPMLSA